MYVMYSGFDSVTHIFMNHKFWPLIKSAGYVIISLSFLHVTRSFFYKQIVDGHFVLSEVSVYDVDNWGMKLSYIKTETFNYCQGSHTRVLSSMHQTNFVYSPHFGDLDRYNT